MSDDRTITPAPKPSQRGKARLPAKDDAVTGVVTYDPEKLRTQHAKRKELLESPDGTPGKDVAVKVQGELDRAKKAAPIIKAAVQAAEELLEIHGKSELVTKRLAEKLVQLRAVYVNNEGHPDMRGRSAEYREAAAEIYRRAGFDTQQASNAMNAVRYHVQPLLRQALKGPGFADGDMDKYAELLVRYELNPDKEIRRKKTTQLPALKVATNNPAATWYGSVHHARLALDVPGDTDPTSLRGEDRETLVTELEAVRDRAEEILDRLTEG